MIYHLHDFYSWPEPERCHGCSRYLDGEALETAVEDSKGRHRCFECRLCPVCGDAELGLTAKAHDGQDVCDECYDDLTRVN